ncbi:NADH dehydrogenase (ubiquinone) PDSW subunit [Nomia melanderi]|uniref:NADH dehydrogenase (ubiquinone) PDSW subunit n=1 Tax=Nomia melanderi TaxID=2448451 RepID=UPI00130435A5|nr:NADH dehydrogenase [ubiquinone] 1 beta subcomplex subunit 10 [Nomia melanderi]
MEKKPGPIVRLVDGFVWMLDAPVIWFRENIVLPNRQKYPYYHQQFRRVPTIDECHVDDVACYFEANHQFLRDKKVDDKILFILRNRYEECALNSMEELQLCGHLKKTYDDAVTNHFIKYGDLGCTINVVDAFMKQKHRMAWERRHGPIGSGMKD